MQTSRVTVTVKFLAVYSCDLCKTTETGSTEEIRLEVGSFEEVCAALATRHPSPHAMPVEWSHHYPGYFLCPTCRTKLPV